MRKKSVLITGIKGFLGSHLSEFLSEEYDVYGVGRTNEVINGTHIFSSDNINDIKLNPDFVIMCHAAVASGQYSPNISELNLVNRDLTTRIANKFLNSRLVYTSSISVFKFMEEPIDEKSIVEPITDYALSKKFGEDIILSRGGVVVRFSSIFGERMKENTLIPNFVNQALDNKLIIVCGKGLRMQNYLYVKSACLYLTTVIKHFQRVKNNNKIILAVSPMEYSNANVAQIISHITNAKIEFMGQDNSKSFRFNNSESRRILNIALDDKFELQLRNYIKWKKKQF